MASWMACSLHPKAARDTTAFLACLDASADSEKPAGALPLSGLGCASPFGRCINAHRTARQFHLARFTVAVSGTIPPYVRQFNSRFSIRPITALTTTPSSDKITTPANNRSRS